MSEPQPPDAGPSAEPASDTQASPSGESGVAPWLLSKLTFSAVVSVVALSISLATFYLTRLKAPEVTVVPATHVAVRWDGRGGGTEFQWLNSKIRLELLFANEGARQTVVRALRLRSNEPESDFLWEGRYDVTGEGRDWFSPFVLGPGGTDLKRIEFTQPGEDNQALGPGNHEVTLEARRDLSDDWEPLLGFAFAIDTEITTRELGQHFGYSITDLKDGR